MWHGSLTSAMFLVSLGLLVVSVQAILLLLMPSRRLLLGAASLFFVIAAASSYFSVKYGAVMNKDMLRNVFETDAAEARGLFTVELVVRLLVLGGIPAILVWNARLPTQRVRVRLRRRIVAIASLLALCGVALVSQAASYAVFFREHKPIRFELMPLAPVTSAIGLLIDERRAPQGPLIEASGVAQRTMPPNARPIVLVLVIGETARAANFQLGGYARATTPQLAANPGVVYFPNVTSCGTSTAISVPCIFSHLPRAQFDVDQAGRYTNLLDALRSAEIDVEWRENNAGCKGVCARTVRIEYAGGANKPGCAGATCFDEVMVEDLPQRLHDIHRDTALVMHQLGSHGPAYYERYPPAFERFKPACRSNQLQRCTTEEVVNAYDNTIVYTDHMLARTIEALEHVADRVDPILIYVSDHGESLGEQGIYLHGMPYAFAPNTQTQVPMLMWLSDRYVARSRIDRDCLDARARQAFSHDNVYHTVLGATEVRNASYDKRLDILAPCRAASLPSEHE